MHRVLKTKGDWNTKKNIPVVKEKCPNPFCPEKTTTWITPLTFLVVPKCTACKTPLLGLELIKTTKQRRTYHLEY